MSGRLPVSPGDPDSSELFLRVSSDDPGRRMPPAYMGHDPLSDAQVSVLRRWILEGAEYSTHWAFVPPRATSPPAATDTGWPRRVLDAFVLARLERQGLAPTAEIAPGGWLRRMMFDATGLAPSPGQVRAFEREVAAKREAAYERAVDRALASPRYGERMATDWLDVARYADTHGFNNDSERSMWRWRDWVIDAFNRNLPYDRFIVEQLAGDLLADPTLEQLIATGFNRNHVINSEGGIIDEEYRVEYVADRVRTLGMAWLGLSIECARCHDHKFDPISQEDYYRLFAFFDNVPELGEAGRVANAVPMIPAPTRSQAREMEALRRRIEELERREQADFLQWNPDGNLAASLGAVEIPADARFVAGCDEAGAEGISGRACTAAELEPEEKVKLEKHGSFTLGMWARLDTEADDAPLFSAIDYSPDPASAQHGRGIELRVVGEEVELRLSTRYPSYSITVRSSGAGLAPRQWRHLTAAYEGSGGEASMRARAAWVRLFVDGREVATRVLHDDLQSPAQFKTPYRLGRDNQPEGAPLAGRIDEVAIWQRALADDEVRQLFQAAALPWAASRADSELERGWLYRALHPAADLEGLRRRLFSLERNLPTSMVMQEMAGSRQTHVLMRGRYDSPGHAVRPGVPPALPGAWPEQAPNNRLGLAQWLTSEGHPTVARVVVNRFWQQVFGVGLVKTSGDFGLQGEAPSHPQLLDWLAVRFRDSGWDVKRLMRMILLSATYRQDSAAAESDRQRDPENRLLSRGPRFRLPAESIRDQALAVAGLLSARVGGPSVRPYQPEGLYDGVVVGAAYPGTVWVQGEGEDLYRRSLYTFWKRTIPHPAMTVFDAPDREFCTVQRSVTNTPLQALTLMNDPTYVEAARNLAQQVLREAAPAPEARLRLLFERVLGRAPSAEELAILGQAHTSVLEQFAVGDADVERFLQVGASAPGTDMDARTLGSFTLVANMLLGTDEAVTKQ